MNVLPLLLLGGAAAYVMTSSKKKPAPFLWVSNDCSDLKIMGIPFSELEAKAKALLSESEQKQEEFKSKFDNGLLNFATKDLELGRWFKQEQGITIGDLDDLALAVAAWKYPNCNISEDNVEFGTVQFGIFVVTFSATVVYAITNNIFTAKDILDGLGEMASLYGTFPEGATASVQLPMPLRMALNI